MLTIKSGSIIIPDLNQQQLKEHAQVLLEKSQQIIKQKLQKIQIKEAKIQAIEKNFIEWAGNKQIVLKQKLEKSSKNKYDHLQKIVKKCRDHKKYLGQKLKIYHSKNRQTLKQAWKKAEEFNNSIQLYQNSKNVSFQRINNKALHQIKNQMVQSLYITQKSNNLNKYEEQKQYLTINYGANNNQSKMFNNNASKQYWNQINRSMNLFKPPELVKISVQQQKNKNNQKNNLNQKLKETLARFRLYSQQQQDNKIQQLGQKLQKIQRNRLKKLESFKKKNDSTSRVSDYMGEQKKDKNKKLQKKNFRIHSESIVRQKRVNDWSQLNRQKREQYQQHFVQNSNQYLQNQKLKHMKTSITKKIVDSTIEKKLFYERLIIH